MFLCYDIIQDVPRLRSLSLSLAISSKFNCSNSIGATIRGLEPNLPLQPTFAKGYGKAGKLRIVTDGMTEVEVKVSNKQCRRFLNEPRK